MRRVCITVDTEHADRPCRDPIGTFDEVFELLGARRIPATFFVVGSWARANPDRVVAIRNAGHQVASHSYSHRSLARMTERAIIEDLVECDRALQEMGIETKPWFRAPYGEMGSGGLVRSAVQRAGYRHVRWDVDSRDWRADATAEQIASKTLEGVERRWPRTANVLFHSWPDVTPRALALLLEQLCAKRAEFETVERAARPRRHTLVATLGETES